MLASELERPGELSARVLNYISGNYEVDQAAVGAFLVEELPKLEDYEIDLILSPVFTPKLADQAVFAELLGGDSVPREQWPALIQQLLQFFRERNAFYHKAIQIQTQTGKHGS